MAESLVREYFRNAFGTDAFWTEAARGGTPGIPDVSINIGGKDLLPIELKWWTEGLRGVRMEMRPSQIRYARLAARDGRRSAIVYGLWKPSDRVGQPFPLFAIPGHRCPRTAYDDRVRSFFLPRSDTDPAEARAAIIRRLSSDDFWR